MIEKARGPEGTQEWKRLKETVLFSSYEHLKTALLKEMHERDATEAEIEIGHLGEKTPFIPALGDRTITFKVLLRGTRTPVVVRENTPEGDLFPNSAFTEWWGKTFTGPYLALETSAFRLSAIKTAPAAKHAAEETPAAEEDEFGLEGGAREERFDEFLYLQERAEGFFQELRNERNVGGKIEATLEAHGANGQIAQFRLEHPASGAKVVWLHEDGERLFNVLRGPEARKSFAALMREHGVDAPYTLALREIE